MAPSCYTLTSLVPFRRRGMSESSRRSTSTKHWMPEMLWPRHCTPPCSHGWCDASTTSYTRALARHTSPFLTYLALKCSRFVSISRLLNGYYLRNLTEVCIISINSISVVIILLCPTGEQFWAAVHQLRQWKTAVLLQQTHFQAGAAGICQRKDWLAEHWVPGQ